MTQQCFNAVFAEKRGGGVVAEQLTPRTPDLECGFSNRRVFSLKQLGYRQFNARGSPVFDKNGNHREVAILVANLMLRNCSLFQAVGY